MNGDRSLPIALETPDLSAAVEARLRQSSYLDLRRIACTFKNGVLTLKGHVPSYFLVQMAQTVVKGLDGVEVIDNQLEVSSRPSSILF